jgi:antitoxin PrlF
MSKGKKNECCGPVGAVGDFQVESIVTVDDRGQMVLPKDIREKAGIKAGDKLAVITREQDGKVCCIYLFKTEALVETIRTKLGPLMGDLVGSK